MKKSAAMLYPLKRVTWGPANNYANSAVTQQTLSDVVYDIETKDPDLKGKAEEACCKSGLHPTKNDPRPHWTFEFLDSAKQWIKTVHVYPSQVFQLLGFLPPVMEEEERRVMERAGKGEGGWKLDTSTMQASDGAKPAGESEASGGQKGE